MANSGWTLAGEKGTFIVQPKNRVREKGHILPVSNIRGRIKVNSETQHASLSTVLLEVPIKMLGKLRRNETEATLTSAKAGKCNTVNWFKHCSA